MPQIGTLITGAGITTPIVGQPQCEEFMTIGDCDTANPLQGIQVEIDNLNFINIQGAQTLVTAVMKWLCQMTGATVGQVLKIATGQIAKATNYRLTNAGATTPAILAASTAPNGVPIVAGTKTINASSNEYFQKFSALFIQTPANVQSIDVDFNNGHRQTYTVIDIDSLFAMTRPSEADGRLGGVSVIDNTGGIIKGVRIYTTAAALTVAVVKLPDASYEVMRAYAEDLQRA